MTKGTPRKKARLAGMETYFTGKPCPSGHVAERYVDKAECCVCRHDDDYQRKKRQKKRKNPQIRMRRRAAVSALRELGIDMGERPKAQRNPIMAFSRADALIFGIRRYYTGKPCKHGHVTSRTVNSGCDECTRLHKQHRCRPIVKNKGRKQEQRKRAKERESAAVKALKELGIRI